jgi:hypothetical protein
VLKGERWFSQRESGESAKRMEHEDTKVAKELPKRETVADGHGSPSHPLLRVLRASFVLVVFHPFRAFAPFALSR